MTAMANGGQEHSPRRAWSKLPGAKASPTPLINALDNLASTLGLTSVDAMNALITDWSSIVGDQLAAQCKPITLREGLLTIEARDHQWATELKWMKALIVERSCDALGDEVVRDVRILRKKDEISRVLD